MGVSLMGAEEYLTQVRAVRQSRTGNRSKRLRELPNTQRRRPTEVERRRLSRPHDGSVPTLPLRTSAAAADYSASAHATHWRWVVAPATPNRMSARRATHAAAVRIAMIVIANHAAANDRAKDAAEDSTAPAARRDRSSTRIGRRHRNCRWTSQRRCVSRRSLRWSRCRCQNLHLRHFGLDLRDLSRDRRRLYRRMLCANHLGAVRRLLWLDRQLLMTLWRDFIRADLQVLRHRSELQITLEIFPHRGRRV